MPLIQVEPKIMGYETQLVFAVCIKIIGNPSLYQ